MRLERISDLFYAALFDSAVNSKRSEVIILRIIICYFCRTTQCTKCIDGNEETRHQHSALMDEDENFIPKSSCEPSFVQKRLVALHPSGEKLFSEVFWFPSACSCQIS